MRSKSSLHLGGVLAAAVLVLSACSGSTPSTRATTAAASAPGAAPATGAAAGTTAAVVPTLQPIVTGVRNGRIAYAVRNADGSSNIFSVRPDGSDEQQLTAGAGNHLCAAFSADGTRIAYCSDATGPFEIWTMQADGSNQTQVTHLAGRALFPDIAPDGKQITFGGVVGSDAHTEVYVVDAVSGESLVALTSCTGKAAGCSNDYPAWSPDGTRIVFIHMDDYVNETPVNEQVWLMDADGGNQHALTTGTTPKDQVPSWSPDGTRIVYASGEADGEGIWVMNADGSAQVQLSGCRSGEAIPCAAGNDFGPIWSPDGSRIAFLRAFQAVGANDRPVYVMNADGTDQRRLAAGTPTLQTVPAWQSLPG